MIDRIREINRIIYAVSKLMDDSKSAEYDNVIEDCKSIVIEGQMPDHSLSITFCKHIGFLRQKGSRIQVTKQGEVFLELNPNRLYELSEAQKRFILRLCYLSGIFGNLTRKCLKSFSPAYKNNTFRWSEVDGPSLDCEEWIPEHLIQLGLLKKGPNYLEVNKRYNSTIEAFLAENKGWTEKELLEYLKEKKLIGDLAEKLILNFEIERLRKLRCFPEAGCSRIISKLKVSEGYDIESFNGKSPDMKFDRFIEVKGSRQSEIRFIWTPNEIETAKKFGDKYWIYYQGGIDKKNQKAKNRPLLFQNPVESILKNGNFVKTDNGLIVTSTMRGELIS